MIADAAAERARTAGDEAGGLLAQVAFAFFKTETSIESEVDELERLARKALPRLEQAGNHAGLAYVWRVLGDPVANFRGRFEEWAHSAEQALRHTRLAGRNPSTVLGLDEALVYGPRPADEALRTLDAVLPESPSPAPLLLRALLLTMLGRFDEADSIAREPADRWSDLMGDDRADVFLGPIASIAGRYEDAAFHLGRRCRFLETRGSRGYLSTYAPELGRVLCKLGRHEEAAPLARLGRELADDQDASAQMLWRQLQALVDSSRGHHSDAEQLAREAVTITERTDALNWQGDAFSDLAEVLHAAGRRDEAEAALTQALERYERKLNLAQAAQTRARLAGMRGGGAS